jgi:hypothetical protein
MSEIITVRNICPFMRDNRLPNRVSESYNDIVALSREAWNRLIRTPSKIMTTGLRDWAHGS